MGFWGSDKRLYEDIPDERLDWNQRQLKKWRSRDPITTHSGLTYPDEGRRIADSRLNASLGFNNIDDLFELKAPRFFATYCGIDKNVYDLCKYVQKNIPENNQLQELKGENRQLKKQCEDQKAMIEKLMAQNEKLQNQLLERSNSQSSGFSR